MFTKLMNILTLICILFIVFLFMNKVDALQDLYLEYNCNKNWHKDIILSDHNIDDEKNLNIKLAKYYIYTYYTDIKNKNKDRHTYDMEDILLHTSDYYGRIIDFEGEVINVREVVDNNISDFNTAFKDKIQFLDIETTSNIRIHGILVSNKYIEQFKKIYKEGNYIFIRGFITGIYKTESNVDYISFVGIIF